VYKLLPKKAETLFRAR